MAENKRVTLHPLKKDGTIDTSINLYPKTLVDGIVDREGNEVDVLTSADLDDVPTMNSENAVKSGGIFNAIEEAKEVIITSNPDDYLNENGLNKIVRKNENGNVEKSYLIDKIHHESTFVVDNADTSDFENNEYLDDTAYFFGDIFYRNKDEIFGDSGHCGEMNYLYAINYNQDGVKTYGVRFGNDEFYGAVGFADCEPNKVIRVIVGKYFEYNEQGEKVFDEHCAFWCSRVVGEEDVEVREITEERQVFELKTRENGGLYFDSDGEDLGFGNTRFILYGFECGEEAHDEYKARQIAHLVTTSDAPYEFEDSFIESLKDGDIVYSSEVDNTYEVIFALFETAYAQRVTLKSYGRQYVVFEDFIKEVGEDTWSHEQQLIKIGGTQLYKHHLISEVSSCELDVYSTDRWDKSSQSQSIVNVLSQLHPISITGVFTEDSTKYTFLRQSEDDPTLCFAISEGNQTRVFPIDDGGVIIDTVTAL